MYVITISQMKQVIEHVAIRLREPVMFLGQFGGGKSEGVRQAAKELGCHLHTVLLGQYDTVDLKGTPWVGDMGSWSGDFHKPLESGDHLSPEGYKATVWHPASTLPFKGNPMFPRDIPIILFLDERTSATVPVMGLCYQLVNDHRIGEHELMDNVVIISAGNRAADKGIVNREPMPLCNRETSYEIGIDLAEWSYWCQDKYGKPAAIFPAFLNFKKGHLCTWDPTKPERCVATPRTVEKAIRYYLDTLMPHEIKMASIAGAVGDGWGADFWGFHANWEQLGNIIPRILKDPHGAPMVDEASMQFAVACAVSGSMNKKTVAACHTYLCRLAVESPEYIVLAWNLACRRKEVQDELYATNEFIDFSKRYKALQ